MKNSVKIAALLVAITGGSFTAKAQSNSKSTSDGVILSIGAESGISVGQFKETQKWNLGGSVQADIPIVRQLYVTLNAGFQNYFGKDNIYGTSVSANDIQMIPVKAGLKFFPVPHLYLQGEAGASIVLNKAESGYDKSTAFIYSPQIGYRVPLSGRSSIDAGVRYEASTRYTAGSDNSKTNTIGLRVAYAFSVK